MPTTTSDTTRAIASAAFNVCGEDLIEDGVVPVCGGITTFFIVPRIGSVQVIAANGRIRVTACDRDEAPIFDGLEHAFWRDQPSAQKFSRPQGVAHV